MSQRKKKGEKLLSGSVMTTEHNKSAPPTHRQRSSSRRGGRQGPRSSFPGLRGSLPWLFQNRVQQRRCPGGRQVPLIWRFSTGVILPPWGYLAMSGAIFFFFVTTGQPPLVSLGQRSGTLPSILQCTGQPLQHKSIQPQISVLLRLRNAVLLQLLNSIYI